jgi:hypothetical protein
VRVQREKLVTDRSSEEVVRRFVLFVRGDRDGGKCAVDRLVEQTETHVLVRLLLLLLLLFLLGSLGVTTSGGTTSGRASSGSTTAGANVRQKVLHVLALKSLLENHVSIIQHRLFPNFLDRLPFEKSYLGEQRGPDGLDLGELSSLDQGLELVGL